MGFKFIAANGDNVGESIGNAIATDNHEELDSITSKLNEAQQKIVDWAESVGGNVVTSSGDEIIVKIPSESYDEATIESIKSQYSEDSQHTVTIGVGDSMSEASKALIYGKLNDKDQVVEYDSHIDDYIASHDEEVPEHEQGLDEEEKELHDATESKTDEEELQEEALADVGEKALAEETDGYTDQEAIGDEEYEDESAANMAGDADIEEDPEYQEEVPEMEETPVEGEAPQEETDEEMPGSELDETLAQEGEMSEDDLDIDPKDKLDNIVGEDLDGDGDPDVMAASDDAMADEEIMDEEDDSSRQSALTDMIHANMSDNESEDMEESDDELKQDIVNSLMTFKENKAMLEQAKTQNPKLYEATILMLRSMIEMAKKLNMNPEADVSNMEAQGELPHADEMADEEIMDENMDDESLAEDEDMSNEDKDESEDMEENFKKSDKTAEDLINIFKGLFEKRFKETKDKIEKSKKKKQ